MHLFEYPWNNGGALIIYRLLAIDKLNRIFSLLSLSHTNFLSVPLTISLTPYFRSNVYSHVCSDLLIESIAEKSATAEIELNSASQRSSRVSLHGTDLLASEPIYRHEKNEVL